MIGQRGIRRAGAASAAASMSATSVVALDSSVPVDSLLAEALWADAVAFSPAEVEAPLCAAALIGVAPVLPAFVLRDVEIAAGRAYGKRALTEYEVRASCPAYSLLKIHLLTGRTHQIRVHFAHIGHPLAGDSLYGGGCPEIGRQALHCARLSFTDPLTGEKITVRSELPRDIRALFPEEKL